MLADALRAIATDIGAETAHQARTVLSKYVAQPLRLYELTSTFPLADADLDLRHHARRQGGPKRGGHALDVDEQERVICYLLQDFDPAEGVVAPKRGRWGLDTRIVRRMRLRDLTLLQAGTGLRISEALAVTRRRVVDNGRTLDGRAAGKPDGLLKIDITADITKTEKSRYAVVLDPRIEEYLRRQVGEMTDDQYVAGAPSDRSKSWQKGGKTGAQKAVADLYRDMADKLDVPALHHLRSHLWRATVTARLLEGGIAREDIAAVLGHDVQTNERYYTDRTDLSRLVRGYRSRCVAKPDRDRRAAG